MDNNNLRFTNEQILDVLALSENPTAIYSSEQMIIQAANDAIISLWGKDRSVIGKTIEEALPELADQPFKEIFLKVMRTGETYQSDNMPAELEVDGKRKLYYFDFKYKAIKNAVGETYCVLNTAIDVTKRYESLIAIKEAEEREQELSEELAASNEELAAMNEELAAMNEELRSTNEDLIYSFEQIQSLNLNVTDSELQLNFAIDAANLGTWDLDPNTNKFEGNERLKTWFGLQSDEKIDLNKATDVIIDKDREKVINAISTAMTFNSGGSFDIDYTILSPSTHIERMVRAKGKALFNENQEVTRFSGTLQDITEEEKIRLALRDTTLGLQIALDAARLGSYDLDLDSGIMACSEQCKKNFGLKPDQPLNYPELMALILPEYRDYVQKQITNALSKNAIYQAEYPIKWADDTEHWIRASGKPHYNHDGKAVRITGVTFDITDQRKDDLRKNDFIGMVSHELKTPLTSLKGYIQMLQFKAAKNGDEVTEHSLAKADLQVHKMNTMINGFLSVSRLESGKIFLEKSEFKLDELVEETIEDNQLLYPSYKIKMQLSEPVTVEADRDKIGHVISNLLSNAAKYSKLETEILVNCKLEGHVAYVSIKDDGMGIDPADIPFIFDRFYRVETKKNISGFGIGLYLSAEIIQRHGGKIGVESTVDKGSVFWFTLPL
ncbi:ATP-binding protein [Pedobacter nototheniae]|uniref:ATP-binding protein n=1 Tax=Pedobacter nototheniae TaxID=2488994 RepID=UPI00292D8A86|nr:ATP-binding protein [Pedobacter nototheniae]